MTDTIFFLWQRDKAREAGQFSSKQGLRQHLYSVPINELKRKKNNRPVGGLNKEIDSLN